MDDEKKKALLKTALKDSAVIQVVLGIILLPMFDGGVCAAIWFCSMAGYWVGCGFILSRRWTRPTNPDLFIVKWGFLILCLLLSPAIAGLVWAIRGVRIQ